MQKKISVNEAPFSLTDPLADFTGLCCFPSHVKQPDISGRLTKIYQDGNNVTIRFMFCRTQNGLLWVLLVSLSFSLPHESKAVSSRSACSAAKGFASESEASRATGSLMLTPQLTILSQTAAASAGITLAPELLQALG